MADCISLRAARLPVCQIDLKDVSSSSKISIKVRPADKIEGECGSAARDRVKELSCSSSPGGGPPEARLAHSPSFAACLVSASASSLPVIEMTTVRMNFLYRQGSSLFFMDPVSFEQVELDVSLLPRGEKAAGYLIENSSTVLKKNGDSFVSIHVPEKVVCTVLDTPSGRTKQVNDTGGKEAKLTNGLTIMLPNFIENGTHIVVNTETDAYVGKSDVPPAPEVETKY